MNTNSNRRALLQSLGMLGPAYFLPSLRHPARAAATPPKRLIVIQCLQGWLQHAWDPIGTESNFTLGEITAPLEPFKSKLLLLSGLEITRFGDYIDMGGTPDGHVSGGMHTLTSAVPGTVAGTAGGPSIDQFVAQQINKPTPLTMLPSFAIAQDGSNDNGSALEWQRTPFYSGPNQRLPISPDALAGYKRLFPSGQMAAGQPVGPDPRVLKQRSVLDFVAKEFAGVKTGLGTDAKRKLDAHADAVRGLENALALSPVAATGCVQFQGAAGLKAGNAYTSAANYESELDIRFRLIQTALACDLTRVVSMTIGNPPPDMWGWKNGLGGAENPHDMAHKISKLTAGPGYAEWKEMQTIFHRQLARLLKLLDDVKESDGQSVLDHSAVVWTNQMGTGNHNWRSHRWIVAGSLGGYFRTGRYLLLSGAPDYSDAWESQAAGVRGVSVGDLHTSLANGMGINLDKFGDPMASTGAIARLR